MWIKSVLGQGSPTGWKARGFVCFALMSGMLWLVLTSASPAIEADFGDGREGSLVVTTQNVPINTVCTPLTGDNIAGRTYVVTGGASGFARNDEVLIITMQDPGRFLSLEQLPSPTAWAALDHCLKLFSQF